MKIIAVMLLFAIAAPSALGQKIKIGFDKSANFSQYHSFSWPKVVDAPEMTMRRAVVKGEIEYALKSKGLARVEENGDLILSGFGGLQGEAGGVASEPMLPTYSTTTYGQSMWTGAPVAGPTLLSGTLVLQMVERSSSKVVWQGVVTQKVDTNNNTKSFDRFKAAIAKMLDKYPPKK